MGEWIRHRGSKSMPKRLEGMRFAAKLRDGSVHVVSSDSDYLRTRFAWVHKGHMDEIMQYSIIGKIEPPSWPEYRIDVIWQNGNTGEHYEIDTSPERVENDAENVHVDMVNEPPHYKQGDVECIDAIKAALTDEEWRGYCKGNALKYIWRERHKGGDESLQKAIWYLNRLVK